MLWDVWADVRADVTGLGEAVEDLSEEENKLAEEYEPDMLKTDEWEADAKVLFDRALPKALYLDKYRNNRVYSARRQPLQDTASTSVNPGKSRDA